MEQELKEVVQLGTMNYQNDSKTDDIAIVPEEDECEANRRELWEGFI